MNHLVPCPECSRHARVTETECPFCAQPLDLSRTPEPQLPRIRLGRAATFAFGATLASVTAVAACGGDAVESATPAASSGAGSGGRGGAGGTDIITPQAGTIGAGTPLYGGPPFPEPAEDGGAGGVLVK